MDVANISIQCHAWICYLCRLHDPSHTHTLCELSELMSEAILLKSSWETRPAMLLITDPRNTFGIHDTADWSLKNDWLVKIYPQILCTSNSFPSYARNATDVCCHGRICIYLHSHICTPTLAICPLSCEFSSWVRLRAFLKESIWERKITLFIHKYLYLRFYLSLSLLYTP